MRTSKLAATAAMLLATGAQAQGLPAAASVPTSLEAALPACPHPPQPAAPAVLLPQRECAFSTKPPAFAGFPACS